jgi:hypothetical protein
MPDGDENPIVPNFSVAHTPGRFGENAHWQ